jgi:hypothetical protein
MECGIIIKQSRTTRMLVMLVPIFSLTAVPVKRKTAENKTDDEIGPEH